ncbi:MAG TPA: hypothetical protein VKY92_26125, partial [Verrucomicrobiae bacterium]|nr:hypothetical protein [Verrucomicrobiae bacterium]
MKKRFLRYGFQLEVNFATSCKQNREEARTETATRWCGCSEMLPLLRAGVVYDPQEAGDYVKTRLRS